MTPDQTFIFATGIECSNPMVQGNTIRRDLAAECGHHDHWQRDLQLVRGLGLRHLRYGLPIHKIIRRAKAGEGGVYYDWSIPDQVLPALREAGITPILDLLHFGLPSCLGDFQNPDFPAEFARYAGAVAERYPWLQFFTPVNEIFVTAKLSAREGLWNEQRRDEASFLRALCNLVAAHLFATRAIVDACPDAVIIPSESVEYVHVTAPEPHEGALLFNELRFLSLDLMYGRPLSTVMRLHLRRHGIKDVDLLQFERFQRSGTQVLGLDYYGHNEFIERPDGSRLKAADDGVFGFARLASEYHARYGLPLMLTETNYWNHEKSPQWLHKMWGECLRLRAASVPLIGFCWYSLTDQLDWDSGLSQQNRHVNGCGLYGLDRTPNPVEPEFRAIIAHWRDLPLFPAPRKQLVTSL